MNSEHETIPIMNTRVTITDSLFSTYVDTVARQLVPYQWDALNDRLPDTEPSHCITNFRIAAGEIQGEHKGAVFQDSDLYKWLETVAFCIGNGKGTEYMRTAEEVIALIGRAQEPDGYINTYFSITCPDK